MKVKTIKTCQLKNLIYFYPFDQDNVMTWAPIPGERKKIQSYQSKSQQLKSHTCITELKTKV